MLARMQELAAWLTSLECRALEGRALIEALIPAFHRAGLEFERFSISIHTRHPELWVQNFMWSEAEGLSLALRDSSLRRHPRYLDSPVAQVYAGKDEVRVQLPEQAAHYPVTQELSEQGYRDYLCLALPARQRSFVSFATRKVGGFGETTLAELRALVPLLALRMELASERTATSSLLRTYLGPNAARHVLAGRFRRGEGQPIEAVIWSCDLRGFTSLVDSTEIGEVLRTLDAYFECVADPIAAQGGEVLKFIGDAVLGIFTGPMHEACSAALHAAQEAFAALETLNEARAERGQAPLRFGVALHRGVVTYGNIGAHERLDFTVIGPAVNEVTRVESLCKQLDCSLLLTAAFARACAPPQREQLRSLGQHPLRGVAEPVELFTLDARA